MTKLKEETIDGFKPASNAGCCGVYAVARVIGKPLHEVMTTARVILRKGADWEGRTKWHEREVLLRHYGVDMVYVGATTGLTLSRFVATVADVDCTYIVTTTGHVQIVRNGVCIDQCETSHVTDFVGRRKRIRSVLRIINSKLDQEA